MIIHLPHIIFILNDSTSILKLNNIDKMLICDNIKICHTIFLVYMCKYLH